MGWVAAKSTKANQRNNGLKLISTYNPKLAMSNELGYPFLPFSRFLKALARPVDVKGLMIMNYETLIHIFLRVNMFAIPAHCVMLLQNYKSRVCHWAPVSHKTVCTNSYPYAQTQTRIVFLTEVNDGVPMYYAKTQHLCNFFKRSQVIHCKASRCIVLASSLFHLRD